ncbi:MAG: hypothetical protein HN380_16795 [Victivallales bacterium]|jgi:neutral ceramidase|nr:hypothetical protein [Victivallales bacterium]
MQAGFHHTDITPTTLPIRTYLGEAAAVMDPLSAQAAAFGDERTLFTMVCLDVVIIEAHLVADIRSRVASQRDIPPGHILVCTTHNHACPAVISRPSFAKDEEYIEFLCERAAEAVVGAIDRLEPARIATGSGLEHRVSFNRRFITRDDCIVSQPTGGALTRVLCNENVVDPELGVLRVQSEAGQDLGVLVNFGCHAVHHMGQLSAGYPGVLRDRLQDQLGENCQVVFLNGPCGNIFHGNFLDPHLKDTKERTGSMLAETTMRILDGMPKPADASVGVTSCTLRVAYRDFEQAERDFADPDVQGNVFQSLIQRGWYDYAALQAMAREREGGEDVEVQVFRLGKTGFAAMPAEYFMEFGLRIKQESPFDRTYVVSLANGWVGYIPTQEAFARKGGHETTTALWSKMRHDAGDQMASTALDLLQGLHAETQS